MPRPHWPVFRLRELVRFICFAGALSCGARGGPVEFGRRELADAFTARGLNPSRLPVAELSVGAAESYAIADGRITGGDERGLMYGLLEAADQIRTAGKLSAARGSPQTPLRGIRYFLHNRDLEENWFYSHDHWERYFAMLARNRFNRFNLVFAHQTSYLAPPYPYWVDLPEFPGVKVTGLTAAQRERNHAMLRFISECAKAHGIDFTLGIWQQHVWGDMQASVSGLTNETLGPYVHAALKTILNDCPAIHSVQMRVNSESGVRGPGAAAFYRDWVFRAIREADHPVLLDIRGWAMSPELANAVKTVGIAYRFSTKYWAEFMGRPYQPAETIRGYSYGAFLEKGADGARPYDFYFELWGLGSNRLLLWGDPDYVRRAVPTLRLSGSEGFEIDPPLAQKGYGNKPGQWGVFAAGESDREFWHYEFERYWLFYQLWGRLSYDAATPDSVWRDEATRRFGPAADAVLAAYKSSSGVLAELVAAHLADPNMSTWPEITPGGILDEYIDVGPSDWRAIASTREAVRNRLTGISSAKQTPFDTAARLDRMAQDTEDAVARAARAAAKDNREWRSSEPDFRVLALLARYHALKQKAAYETVWFDETADRSALASAEKNLTAALGVWEKLSAFTDGLYPAEMSFGPTDAGHWKARLPYVRYDLDLIRERAAVYDRFGHFDFGFDFEGAIVPIVSYGNTQVSPNHQTHVWQVGVEPRFQHVEPDLLYNETSGYGWAAAGARTAVAIPPRFSDPPTKINGLNYQFVSAILRNPVLPPTDVLFPDFIRGHGPQIFKIKAPDGPYTVSFLHPDRSTTDAKISASGGLLSVPFPDGEWEVSGLVVKSDRPNPTVPALTAPELPRPTLTHVPPAIAEPGRDLKLSLQVSPTTNVASVRLHYRAVNQTAKFQIIENSPNQTEFVIPGKDIGPTADLMYYFEILNPEKSGWFVPDTAVATPYHVVTVGPPAHGPGTRP